MKNKNIGGLHFNNIEKRITLVCSSLNIEKLKVTDMIWSQWDNITPKKLYDTLEKCDKFRYCSIIGYNQYDANDKFEKYLSKFKTMKKLKLTHSVYNQILVDVGEKNKYFAINRNGQVQYDIPNIYYHLADNTKIIYQDHNVRTDYGMAFLICLHLAIRYMKNKKLI